MPIFEFECPKCGKTVEKIISYEESEKTIKCDCGKSNLKKNTAFNFNFTLKGNWFKNNQSY
jgi:putative FmdB family regulatory protein